MACWRRVSGGGGGGKGGAGLALAALAGFCALGLTPTHFRLHYSRSHARTHCAVAIMRGPEAVEPAEKETLGFLLSLLLNLGILIGSQAALVFVNL